MSRTVFSLHADDISAFARSLSRQMAEHERAPSHLELLNMLARSAGFRNFQHFRSQTAARERIEASEAPDPVDYVELKRIARLFDAKGRLQQWPARASHRLACLWVLWSRIPARQPLAEEQLNRLLKSMHAFADPALLRRELFDHRLMSRTADGNEYRRIESRPPAGAIALIRHLQARLSA